jgi:hypothetical protein
MVVISFLWRGTSCLHAGMISSSVPFRMEIRRMRLPLVLVLVLFLLGFIFLCFSSDPACAQSAMQKMALEQQDGQMFTDMRRVSNWVNQYCIWNKRFPEQGTEFREAKSQLNQLVPNNPYVSNKLLLSQGLDADPVYTNPAGMPSYDTDYQRWSYAVPDDQAANLHRIILTLDQSLTELDLQQDQQQAPDDWTAPAGSITVISNQQNLYAVWGAGRDGKPLKDPLSGVTQIIIGRYALLNFGE